MTFPPEMSDEEARQDEIEWLQDHGLLPEIPDGEREAMERMAYTWAQGVVDFDRNHPIV